MSRVLGRPSRRLKQRWQALLRMRGRRFDARAWVMALLAVAVPVAVPVGALIALDVVDVSEPRLAVLAVVVIGVVALADWLTPRSSS